MKRIVTDKAPAALGPYVQAVDTGSTVYCSGQLGLDPVTNVLAEGARGDSVRTVQYVLSVVSEFYSNIPRVAIDGIYGPATKNAVIAVQRMAGLPQDGIMGPQTWAALYRLYAGIVDTVETYTNVIPEQFRPDLPESQATGLTQYPGQPMTLGSADERGVSA